MKRLDAFALRSGENLEEMVEMFIQEDSAVYEYEAICHAVEALFGEARAAGGLALQHIEWWCEECRASLQPSYWEHPPEEGYSDDMEGDTIEAIIKRWINAP